MVRTGTELRDGGQQMDRGTSRHKQIDRPKRSNSELNERGCTDKRGQTASGKVQRGQKVEWSNQGRKRRHTQGEGEGPEMTTGTRTVGGGERGKRERE